LGRRLSYCWPCDTLGEALAKADAGGDARALLEQVDFERATQSSIRTPLPWRVTRRITARCSPTRARTQQRAAPPGSIARSEQAMTASLACRKCR
jgi:hypothetical protein